MPRRRPPDLKQLKIQMSSAALTGLTRDEYEKLRDDIYYKILPQLGELANSNPALIAMLTGELAAAVCWVYPEGVLRDIMKEAVRHYINFMLKAI